MTDQSVIFLSVWKLEIDQAYTQSSTLCMAIFMDNGEFIFANKGMRDLFKTDVNKSFINPTIDNLLHLNTSTPLIFEGLMTIGDESFSNTTLVSKVYRKDKQMLIIGEVDVKQLSDQNEIMLHLNNEISNLQRQLIKEKKTLELTLKQLKETQVMLIHSEKMNSLGNLVAGVAHEINNPVAFVSSNVHALKNAFNDVKNAYGEINELVIKLENDLITQKLKTINEKYDVEYNFIDFNDIINSSADGLNRVKTIVEDLRRFSRLDESKCKQIDLIANIKSTISLASSELKKQKIACKFISPDELLVECYPSELNQALLNLLINAIQAITVENGSIVIEVIDKTTIIEIKIADNGMGIPDNIKKDIFNPFFTTKPIGSGTGLGLSIAYKIVTDLHKGTLNFVSEVNKGTEFTIIIPSRIKEYGTRH